MAFFDEIGKKISLASEGAVSKGKAFADSARLNSAIAEEEKKINNAYFQIGKLYFALHSQDCESNFEALIDSIFFSQEKITELRMQVQKIKGVTRCEKCGAEIPNNIAFCSACGSQVSKKEIELDENHIRCSECGAIIDKNLRFCTSCGKPLVKPIQENISISPAKTEPVCSGKNCPSCGAEIREGTKFCTACGYSFDNPITEEIYSNSSVTSDVSSQKVCPSCGSLMDNELQFCTECGTSLN